MGCAIHGGMKQVDLSERGGGTRRGATELPAAVAQQSLNCCKYGKRLILQIWTSGPDRAAAITSLFARSIELAGISTTASCRCRRMCCNDERVRVKHHSCNLATRLER